MPGAGALPGAAWKKTPSPERGGRMGERRAANGADYGQAARAAGIGPPDEFDPYRDSPAAFWAATRK
jgi:hypothetical protein